ncbi:MAG: 5-dehydro-2-deoxygluconokinase [Oceanospirillaceae bacterium]
MYQLKVDHSRELDVICLGRAGVDLYAQQPQQSFSEVTSFNKFVGGSPANIATTIAKLGGKAGFIGCVSADGLGDYVHQYLTEQGINLEGMHTDDSGTRTSLAITQMQPNDPEVVLYRNNAADLALKPQHIQASYIQRAKILLISGTALCMSPSREAALLAMKLAKSLGTVVVLDMDYRAYSWSDTQTASLYYQIAVALADIVIGNTEEFAILEALNTQGCELTKELTATCDDSSAQNLLDLGCQLVIIKAGEEGSKVYAQNQSMFKGAVFQVQAQKPFGAGDAFAGSLLFALLAQYTLKDAVAMGAASAAINVAGSSCTEASPNLTQLEQFMSEKSYQFNR